SENDVDFWLTSHIYCGECGAPLHGTSGTGKSGKTHYYYTCLNHKKHKCSLKNKKKKLLESIVEYVINKKLQDPFIRLCIAEMCYDYYQEHNSDNGAYLESLKHKLKTVNEGLSHFVHAIAKGIYNETTQQAMLELENQKHFLEEQIETEELKEKYEIKFETIVRYFDSFYKDFDDVDIKQRVLDLFVDKILIYEDKLVITFHFLDDNKELSYKEMEETLENEAFIMSMMGDTGNWKEPTTKSKTKKKDSTDFFQ
ncbi:MAG: zinc ribbon domain-containing protein, partial [Ruminiclostridium sp.]|nr:zinc ribbon domain-containing protein [Ruminiclostridium sp.]